MCIRDSSITLSFALILPDEAFLYHTQGMYDTYVNAVLSEQAMEGNSLMTAYSLSLIHICIDNVRDSQQNAAVFLYGYTKAPGTDRKGFYCGQRTKICGVRYRCV